MIARRTRRRIFYHMFYDPRSSVRGFGSQVLILGFFFDFLEITLIILPVFEPIIRTLAPIFAPHLGIEMPDTATQQQVIFVEKQVIYWFAILVAVNLQTSFLTPPFGFALFYMKGVAPSSVRMQ